MSIYEKNLYTDLKIELNKSPKKKKITSQTPKKLYRKLSAKPNTVKIRDYKKY